MLFCTPRIIQTLSTVFTAFTFACGSCRASTGQLPDFIIERPNIIAGAQLYGALPLVRIRVNGKEGLFLLDTGSSHTVFSTAFAKTLGLKVVGNSAGKGPSVEVTDGSILEASTLMAGGSDSTTVKTFTLKRSLVFSLKPLSKLGLSGVFSPQSLIERGCVVLDFKKNRVDYGPKGASVCVNKSADFIGKTKSSKGYTRPIIDLQVFANKVRSAPVLIDTGAAKTTITQNYLANIDTQKKQLSLSASGEVRRSAKAYDVHLRIGKYDKVLPFVLAATSGEKSKLGMDVLAQARIILSKDGAIYLHF